MYLSIIVLLMYLSITDVFEYYSITDEESRPHPKHHFFVISI